MTSTKAIGAPVAVTSNMDDELHRRISALVRQQLVPSLPDDTAPLDVEAQRLQLDWLAQERAKVSNRAAIAPSKPGELVAWFEDLRESGPGQRDPLFPWLAEVASLDELRWFLRQEIAGEAGFDDLVALTQLRMPERAKLELARNYWDEMGRGRAEGMHGPMLERLAVDLALDDMRVDIVWESVALGNLLAGFAVNRGYAFHSIGALGVVELTAPGRAEAVNVGLKRLGVPPKVRQYYALHATLDVKHSRTWNDEVLYPLVSDRPEVARAIAEGALMRLEAGARCFARYRAELGLAQRIAA